jgi:uncharacterized repeat protein (TIGR04138 family)
MHEPTFEEDLEKIVMKDPRYHRDAYVFVREALDRTQKSIHREGLGRRQKQASSENHISGQQLLEGIREYALSEFGPMALTVFEEWGIQNCRDFGEIVFNMVNAGLLKKTEEDSVGDFEGGYDFNEAFRKPFLPSSKYGQRKEPVKQDQESAR